MSLTACFAGALERPKNGPISRISPSTLRPDSVTRIGSFWPGAFIQPNKSTRLCNPREGDLRRNHFRVRGLDAGNYEILVVGEDSSGMYNVVSVGPANQYTIFDKPCGLDNFILTPEPATIMLLGQGGLALIRRKR